MSSLRATKSAYETTVHELDLSFNVVMLRDKPAELAVRLGERIKLAAKYLGRTAGIQHRAALEPPAQAVRFPNWHQLSAHLARSTASDDDGRVPATWPDALSGALLLLSDAQPEIAMPEAQLRAFERFAATLAMLTDASTREVLDGVCASLCAGKTWVDVLARNPMKSTTALYRFDVDDAEYDAEYDDDDEEQRAYAGGYFETSAACYELTEELDEEWQGYGRFTKPEKRRARVWVEKALAAQPGFLEAGLALATMQHDAGEAEATATLERFIRQAEALIPEGYKGPIPWFKVGNRFYLRMMWLRLEMHYEAGDLKSAARFARKLLKLSPGDSLGVRFVLPLLLLKQGDHLGAMRATKWLHGEHGHLASTIRAFCQFAVGDKTGFRRELAAALISLPWLRVFLTNQRKPLPDGDDGVRGFLPDTELFSRFAWWAYVTVPGLMEACQSFLAEPKVLEAEAGLRRYWKALNKRGEDSVGSFDEWGALCRDALESMSSSAVYR